MKKRRRHGGPSNADAVSIERTNSAADSSSSVGRRLQHLIVAVVFLFQMPAGSSSGTISISWTTENKRAEASSSPSKKTSEVYVKKGRQRAGKNGDRANSSSQ